MSGLEKCLHIFIGPQIIYNIREYKDHSPQPPGSEYELLSRGRFKAIFSREKELTPNGYPQWPHDLQSLVSCYTYTSTLYSQWMCVLTMMIFPGGGSILCFRYWLSILIIESKEVFAFLLGPAPCPFSVVSPFTNALYCVARGCSIWLSIILKYQYLVIVDIDHDIGGPILRQYRLIFVS